MAKNKAYVVWIGRKPGVYLKWEECKKEVDKYFAAKYMGFKTLEEAKKAFEDGYKKHWGAKKKKYKRISEDEVTRIGHPIKESIAVDGAWDTSTGIVEYQAVSNWDRKKIFHKGPYEDGTINIVEFLAIVHALSYCKKNNILLPIYSDSKIAINWVKRKQQNTNHERSSKNKFLFDLLDRAVKWLEENDYPNKILKWETKVWGENPADFGRK